MRSKAEWIGRVRVSRNDLVVCCWCLLVFTAFSAQAQPPAAATRDYVRELQTDAIQNQRTAFGHWGLDPENYIQWGTHSNRLIPVYTIGTRGAGAGIDLSSYQGEHSVYRNAAAVEQLYGTVPDETVNPEAEYFDQTDLYRLQLAALKQGKRHVFLVIFDGMDWQTTWAAAIHRRQAVSYREGRGTGLHFQDYTAQGTTQYGWMVTSPHNEGTTANVDSQQVTLPNGKQRGGFSSKALGSTPWSITRDLAYPIGKSNNPSHAYTDSSSSATSMTAGIKTYNNAVNVDPLGRQVTTIAHQAQEAGWKVGAVTSVPISHATPAASYAHNVERDDYQDLARDMLGLPSIAHPEVPLPGLDVVIGTGWGAVREKDQGQGKNFVPGNAYLTMADLERITLNASAATAAGGAGKYVVAQRTPGQRGAEVLAQAAATARTGKHRLLGFFGVAKTGHLPFGTADGEFNPTIGRKKEQETYTPADIAENPVLADFTQAAIDVLSADKKPFWLMVEAGDVDWANHDNNLDNSIGAVLSGEAAVRVITEWVERNSNWNESLLIVTADHGHYLHLTQPELLIGSPAGKKEVGDGAK